MVLEGECDEYKTRREEQGGSLAGAGTGAGYAARCRLAEPFWIGC